MAVLNLFMERLNAQFKQNSAVCLLLLWMPTLWAADSGWLVRPQNDHAKVQIRAEPSADDKTRMLLSVQLEKGWKTYWRSPGEGGIAPVIAWATPLESVKWYWPVPQRFDVSGFQLRGIMSR